MYQDMHPFFSSTEQLHPSRTCDIPNLHMSAQQKSVYTLFIYSFMNLIRVYHDVIVTEYGVWLLPEECKSAASDPKFLVGKIWVAGNVLELLQNSYNIKLILMLCI